MQTFIKDYIKVNSLTSKNSSTEIDKIMGGNDSPKIVHVFTDGSCYNNSKKSKKSAAGIGIFWGDNDYRNLSEPFFIEPITNNRAEIYAVIKAIEIFSISYDQKCSKQTLQINSDSEYLINTMTKWYKKWKQNGWKKSDGKDPLNLDLLCHLDNIIEKHKNCFNIYYKHVPAHRSEPSDKSSIKYFEWYGNNKADAMAKAGTEKFLTKGYCK
jgi:ribonuclease HI